MVAGVTEPASATTFRNEVVAWGPSGRIVATFEKVHRVPFGEYVPFRSFMSHLADLSAVPTDAVPGHTSGLLRTPAGPLGTLVSFEVFYASRSHASVRAGAELLIVPTNTSSYGHVASARPKEVAGLDKVQAVETGRDLVQAAPTGYSTVVTQRGALRQRSVLGRRQVLTATVALRRGFTPYDHLGDLPVLVLSAASLLLGLAPPAPRRPSVVVARVDVDAGDAGRHVHGVVLRVVFEGQAEVEPVLAEVVHGALLEPGDRGAVAPLAHDQDVPAQSVALEPGQGLGLDPVGTAGQQDHGQGRIEELEQPGDLIDDRIIPTGLEEGFFQVAAARSRKCWRPAPSDSTPSMSKTTAGPGIRCGGGSPVARSSRVGPQARGASRVRGMKVQPNEATVRPRKGGARPQGGKDGAGGR